MKKILLTVIFFLLCLILFLIYNKFNTNNLNILYIGENNTYYKYLSSTKYFINKYTYDTITYKDIKNEIINSINMYKLHTYFCTFCIFLYYLSISSQQLSKKIRAEYLHIRHES